jgi:hypothetical protein
MIWGSLPYDRPIRHGITQCRAFITTERDGYFCERRLPYGVLGGINSISEISNPAGSTKV